MRGCGGVGGELIQQWNGRGVWGATLVAEVGGAMSLRRGRLIEVSPACPLRGSSPHPVIPLATCSTERSHALLFGWLFNFPVALLSDYLSV